MKTYEKEQVRLENTVKRAIMIIVMSIISLIIYLLYMVLPTIIIVAMYSIVSGVIAVGIYTKGEKGLEYLKFWKY